MKMNSISSFNQMMSVSFLVLSESLKGDIYDKAMAYCVAIIALHPFKNGNHRTSLIAAERFLALNHYTNKARDEDRIRLEEWRLRFEEEHDLHREFFSIANIEKDTVKAKRIKDLMKSSYGKELRTWLTQFNSNEPSHKT